MGTDMGLAIMTHTGHATSTCGTPVYFAPEIIQGIGYTNAVDWWAFGVLVFELMSGYVPFMADGLMEIFALIQQGPSAVIPNKWSVALKQFIKNMLKVNPTLRLPMKAGGPRNITKDKWYKNFDWDAFRAQTMPPPYVPTLTSARDLSNFQAHVAD